MAATASTAALVALLAPHFCCFLSPQQDFGRSGPLRSMNVIVSDL